MKLSHYRALLQEEVSRGFSPFMRETEKGLVADFDLKIDVPRLLAEEASHRKAVNTAAVYWIIHRRWPLASPLIAQYCMLRLVIAARFLNALAPLRPCSNVLEEAVLLWLLVDYWQLAGCAWWRDQRTES